jgi:hypothetical protein
MPSTPRRPKFTAPIYNRMPARLLKMLPSFKGGLFRCPEQTLSGPYFEHDEFNTHP